MNIVSAPWVVTGKNNIIMDGAVAFENDRIVEVGTRKSLCEDFAGAVEKKYDCLLMPGLVNAHMHLELSYLGCRGNTEENSRPHIYKEQSGQSFTDWISGLIEQRAKSHATPQEIEEAIKTTLGNQYESGVVLIADIGNRQFDLFDIDHKTQNINKGSPQVYRMLEFLAPNKEAQKNITSELSTLKKSLPATAHAPYSVGPELLKYIKTRCREFDHIFSIHTLESIDEREFIFSGSGPLKRFLEHRNSWDGLFAEHGHAKSSVEYFADLDILDESTLLVHCVHLDAGDIALIAGNDSKICLCPHSNEFLGVGAAPVKAILDAGILPAIGTDSITSNLSLDMWREMEKIYKDHPAVAPVDIFSMATSWGAAALHHDDDYGTLEVGKRADFIHVSSGKILDCTEKEDIYRVLVSEGRPEEISHITAHVSH